MSKVSKNVNIHTLYEVVEKQSKTYHGRTKMKPANIKPSKYNELRTNEWIRTNKQIDDTAITAKAKYSVNMTKLSLQKHSPKMVLSKLISGSPCD